MAESEMYAVNGDLSIPKPKGVSEVYIVNGDTSVARPSGVSPVYAVNGDTSIPCPSGVSPIYVSNIESETACPAGVSSVRIGNFSVTPPEPPGPPPLPEKTLRFQFSDTNFDPTTKTGLNSANWTWAVHDASNGIWDLAVTKTGSNWNQLFGSVFTTGSAKMDSATAKIIDADLTGIENGTRLFYSCYSLTEVALRGTVSLTSTSHMFESCSSLTTVPLFDTSSVTNMSYMFDGCTSLTTVPLFDTSSVTNMYAMFNNCKNVQSGALALYQQASRQTTPPTSHSYCFQNCGSNTTTGRAELAQIPSGWK